MVALNNPLFSSLFFIGDTFNYLEHAHAGGLLTTFITHVATWPPLTAMVLNLFVRLPFSPIIQLRAYLIVLSLLSLTGLYLIFREFSLNKIYSFLLSLAIILVNPISSIFVSPLSEPLFISLWIWAVYLAIRYLKNRQELFLILALSASSLLPLARYQGIFILLAIAAYLFWQAKSNKERYLISSWSLLALMPITFYLFKNKLTIGTFLPLADIRSNPDIIGILFLELKYYLAELWIPLGIGVWLGKLVGFKKSKNLNLILWLSFVFIVTQLILLIKYPVLDNIPGRYRAVVYPLVFILSLDISSKFKQNFNKLLVIPFILISLWAIKFIYQQPANYLNSNQLMTFCELSANASQRYVLIHPHSRNWPTRGMQYLCPDAVLLDQAELINYQENDMIYTPYELSANWQLIKQLEADKNINLYQATQAGQLNIKPIFDQRSPYD